MSPFLEEEHKEHINYAPHQFTSQEMQELEQIIIASEDATDYAKRLFVWLLRETNHFTRRVAVSLRNAAVGEQLVNEVRQSARAIMGCYGTTDLFRKIGIYGTQMNFTHHQGCFNAEGFDMMEDGHTFWYTFIYHDSRATVLPLPSQEVLEAISLESKSSKEDEDES
ncbi:MAG: hypothetical protein AAB407_01045 [Patescibacteria group bacterium]